MKRTVISKKMLEALVEKGVVVKGKRSKYWCKYGDIPNHLTALSISGEHMYKELIFARKHKIEVTDDENPYESTTGSGWFVPEWIFVDRQKDLLKDYEEKEKNA